MDLPIERTDYRFGSLDDDSVGKLPIELLAKWIEDARQFGVVEPTAMCLSTVGPDLRPSSRFVLLRGLGSDGLKFFTNYDSRKGKELAENPWACVNFWWGPLERQVRVEGSVCTLSEEESYEYFISRPAESRTASAASPQSRPIASREELESLVRELEAKYPEGAPKPSNWGGYVLKPVRFEFWQGRPARLHDRFQYDLSDGEWALTRLAP